MKLLKLPPKKEMSLGVWTLKRPSAPEKLFVPVYADAPFYQKPCVVPDQIISSGAKIAEPRLSAGIPVFSPMNGSIGSIAPAITASGESVLAIEILVDRKNPYSFLPVPETFNWEDSSAERLRVQIREAGIVLSGPAKQPLITFLEKSPFHKKTLIINACESEPYITSDQVLLLGHPMEVLKGAEIMRRAAGLEKIIFALSQDADQAIELLKSKIYFLKWGHVEVRVFPARYPQDEPAILLPMIDPEFAREHPQSLQLRPLAGIAAAFAAYEAVVSGKPFFERVVTITGECIVQPQNMWLPLGMQTGDAAKACKGFLREPGRWLAGGPMRGRSILSMQEAVSAQTTALVGLPKELSADEKSTECIRCGECAPACPVDLTPILIAAAAWREDFGRARELDAARCIGCGNCSYVCPSHLPLAETVKGSF